MDQLQFRDLMQESPVAFARGPGRERDERRGERDTQLARERQRLEKIGVSVTLREARQNRVNERDRVTRTVEEIGIAEGDVFRASGNLPPDVLQDNVALHDAEHAAING